MRALHLVKTVDGAAWALRQIAMLRRAGVEVVVALPSATGGLVPSYRAAGAEVVAADLDFDARRPWRLPGAVRRCRALVEHVRPDLVHSHFVSTTLVARLALGRAHPVPRVFQVPGPLHLESAPFRRIDLATAGPRDYWVGSCRWTCEEYLRRGVARERVFLSYYGAALDALTTGARGVFRRALGADSAAPLVGMVAHVYAPKWFLGQRRGVKGHEDFIDAFREIARREPAARGVVVGGPWAGAARYARRLRAYARRRCGNAILFTGHRDDVPAVYADLDVAVHPSLSENCGGAVESLAAGCPTGATAVGGFPDLVIDGETGWLAPPRAPARLATAVLEALADRDEARRRAVAGQRLVRRFFAAERTGAEIAGIYRHILDRSHRVPSP
jgi:glycosyltransferase involved in cell wall biosynthesis